MAEPALNLGLSGPPSKSVELLARALLSPLPEARSAWEEWRSTYDLKRTSWSEVRMLGGLAQRIELLDPGSLLAPRMRGIRKFLWVTSQACLSASLPGIARISKSGIRCLLMKGAARIAADRTAIAERLIRDVDILVPWQESSAAFDALVEDGWGFSGWQVDSRREAPFSAHHAWSLTKGKGELDVHHFSNTLNRLVGDDDGLWQRARPWNWDGLAVWLPSPTDGLLISLIHGARHSFDGSGDWLVDAARLMEGGDIDWALLIEEARSRAASAIVWHSLCYLDDILGSALVPAEVLAQLQADGTPGQFAELPLYARTNWPSDIDEETALLRGAIERSTLFDVVGRHGVWSAEPPNPAEIQAFTLEPGEHDLNVAVSANHRSPASALRVAVHSPKMLMQSRVEAVYVVPGLPLGQFAKAVTSADAHGVARFELILPSSLLSMRRIDSLKLSLFAPAYVGEGRLSVQLVWV